MLPIRERDQHETDTIYGFVPHPIIIGSYSHTSGFTRYHFLNPSILQLLAMDVLRKRMEVHLIVRLVAKRFDLH